MNKIRRLEQHLREKFTHSLPTISQMERPLPGNIDFHIAWERQHQQDVLAWKTCLLILDPDNDEPNFRSIARLRSDTVKGDPRRYSIGFDNTRWEEVVEEDLARDLDDASYYQFLELKLADWAKANICRKLDWTPKMYEFAMERLRNSKNLAPTEPAEPVATNEDETLEDEYEDATSQAKPGWPKDEVRALGLTINAFCREIGIAPPQLYNFAKEDTWPDHWRTKINAALDRLKQARAPEPAMDAEPDEAFTTEPALPE